MDKLELKKKLIEIEETIIHQAETNYEDYISGGVVDRTEAVTDDDHSHQHENTVLSNQLDRQVHEHEEHIQQIQEIDFGATDVVRPGAVVKVNGRYMVVAVSKPKFEFAGNTFISISTDAPIYQCIAGKKAGDQCQFNNVKFEIQEVL